jgi:orotate phosphoribosyltransferase
MRNEIGALKSARKEGGTGMMNVQEGTLKLFADNGAAWVYEGPPDPAKPHAELASGACSNGYFNCRKVLCQPDLCGEMASHLIDQLLESSPLVGAAHNKGNLVVVGSPYSAITFSYEVARQLRVDHFFAEKDPKDPDGKRFIFKEELPEGAEILRVEELITTMGTTQGVAQAILERKSDANNVVILPLVGTVILRPNDLNPEDVYEGVKVVALVRKAVQNWDLKKGQACPYCAVGSKKVKPKANWKLLTTGVA